MKVSVIGFGTVGAGVYEMLKNADGYETGKVLVLPEFKNASDQTTNIRDILDDPSVDAVVEAIGGVDVPYAYAKAALEKGKHVVSSNKALIAEKGVELHELARKNGVKLMFSAACGGAVPILHNLRLARQTDEILNCGGILNGTTNFILDKMQRTQTDYQDALREAQALGYAEKDPTADVSGLDTLRKMILMSAVAYDMLPKAGMLYEGIEAIRAADMTDILRRGYVARLMGFVRKHEDGIAVYVEPVLVKSGTPASAVPDNMNLAYYTAKNAGYISLSGQGAGRYPTASAVLRDLTGLREGAPAMLQNVQEGKADCGAEMKRYYVRTARPDALPVAQQLDENRFITKQMRVIDMHEIADRIRKQGGEIFFAGIEE